MESFAWQQQAGSASLGASPQLASTVYAVAVPASDHDTQLTSVHQVGVCSWSSLSAKFINSRGFVKVLTQTSSQSIWVHALGNTHIFLLDIQNVY